MDSGKAVGDITEKVPGRCYGTKCSSHLVAPLLLLTSAAAARGELYPLGTRVTAAMPLILVEKNNSIMFWLIFLPIIIDVNFFDA